MSKRFRSITIIVFIIACTLVAATTAVAVLIVPMPWKLVAIGVAIFLGAGALYVFTSALMRGEKQYHGADYAAMIDSITGGVLVLDGNERIYTVSNDARRYLDLPEKAIGMSKTDAIKDPELLRCIERAALGESNLTEYTSHGVTLRVLVDPVIFSGQIVGTMLLLLDMGEQLTLQKLKREFTANVSHELKTPLTSISGYAEMIATGLASEKDVPEFAARIQKESKRLLALISDIIRLSSLDEGAETDREPVDLAEVADECCDVLARSAEEHGVTIEQDLGDFVIEGSRSLLSELIYNLIDNAIRYNKQGGKVLVKVAEGLVCVEDTGIGIPEEHIPHIFERFYRVDKSRSKETGGTGLGLAIVKHVTEKYGGKVLLESKVGEGTKITLDFSK
jgi:two-component system phosphate regulon sensor histidine kinase PhoR